MYNFKNQLKRIIIISIILISGTTYSQDSVQKRHIALECTSTIDSLKLIYSYNKQIPSQYEVPVYMALSYFPELDSSKIICKNAKIKTTLNARPTLLSLIFRKKSNRTYIIRINNAIKDSIVTLKQVPLNAMIGLFGHEFSHFIDYNSRNFFGVLSRLFDYTSKASKEKFEKEIDLMCIKRGLGRQLYDWSHFVLHQSSATKKYKDYKRLIYLEPKEILEILNHLNKHKANE